MEMPPVAVSHAEEPRQTYIAVVKDCTPAGDKEDYEKAVLEILKTNGIQSQPIATSNYSCSFTIKLLKEEKIKLLKSNFIDSIDLDHNIYIPEIS